MAPLFLQYAFERLFASVIIENYFENDVKSIEYQLKNELQYN